MHLLRKNYPIKLEIKDITDIVRSALYLDLRLEIDNEGRITTKLHDKRDDCNVPIVNFPFQQHLHMEYIYPTVVPIF